MIGSNGGRGLTCRMVAMSMMTALFLSQGKYFANSLVVPLTAARPSISLRGIQLSPVAAAGTNDTSKEEGEATTKIDLGEILSRTKSNSDKTMLVLGTHPADFNTLEYLQKIRAAWSDLRDKSCGVTRCLVVINGEIRQCRKLADMLDLPAGLEILADPTGQAGRAFGVSRGWRPDDDAIPAWLKVTVVGIGLGPPWGTLPAVLTGYFGNPWGRREWIEETLKQGQLAGRWPAVLELNAENENAIVGNKFDDFPLLSGWGRRPLELATMRLQNLIGIQIKHWDELKPVDDRCLTQLGGCTVVGEGGEAVYSWVDQGLCDVPDMNKLVDVLRAV
eukprot:CAMPEP_0172517656 /NCGR_PEP_ID=MMETSP1066-20121228/286885_1 /TAXON_ID=671091 /ORGANISM="Coscinodiscus wailesii, Strain CCMP2513" /LENGTH=332 /DNA_ID=CAMNT_0013299775 /DNA_START=28 /DNA_END=1026 /DNA_ORIENTATION=+